MNLTVAEVAERWRCSPKTIRRRLKAGALEGFRDGGHWLVPERAVREYEAANSNVAVSVGRSP